MKREKQKNFHLRTPVNKIPPILTAKGVGCTLRNWIVETRISRVVDRVFVPCYIDFWVVLVVNTLVLARVGAGCLGSTLKGG